MENEIIEIVCRNNRTLIKLKNSLFQIGESYSIILTYENICFKPISLDYSGKTYKVSPLSKNNQKTGYFSTSLDLTEGSYQIDENSSEDEIIVYFEDLLV